jgi:phosphatidate phosphatase LPIN
VTDHSDLVVKYGGRYLTWDNASPVLASLAVYRKSLVDHPEHHRHVNQSEVDTKRPGRGWSSWWSRKGGGAESTISLPAREMSPPVSPPMSPPDSPRSLPILESSVTEPVSPVFEAVKVDADHKKHYAKTLRLTSDQLVSFFRLAFPTARVDADLLFSPLVQKTLGLKKGMNVVSFSVRSSYSGYATCTSRIFLWESDFSVVISDIDGTITKCVRATLSETLAHPSLLPSPLFFSDLTLSDTCSP